MDVNQVILPIYDEQVNVPYIILSLIIDRIVDNKQDHKILILQSCSHPLDKSEPYVFGTLKHTLKKKER